MDHRENQSRRSSSADLRFLKILTSKPVFVVQLLSELFYKSTIVLLHLLLGLRTAVNVVLMASGMFADGTGSSNDGIRTA